MASRREHQRLTALRSLDLLDTPPEEAFDSLTDLAATLLRTRMAAVSLIDADRQWFKSNINIPAAETPRDVAFCDHAIRGPDVFFIPDALADPRFADNPLVTGPPNIRGYAGIPLREPGGETIGTLCVIHDQPLDLSGHDLTQLRALGRVAEERIAERARRNETEMSNRILAAMSNIQSQFIDDRSEDTRVSFDSLLESVLDLTRSEYGFIGEVIDDHTGRYLRTWAITNIAWDDETRQIYEASFSRGMEFRNLDTLFGQTIRTGEMVLTDSPAGHPAAAGTPKGHPPLKTYAGLPLYSHGEFVAMLGIANRPDGYAEADIHRLRPLLQSISDLIYAYRMSRTRDRLLGRLEAVTELGRIGSWEVDLASGLADWDETTRKIHEVEPDYVASIEEGIDFYAPEVREELSAAIEHSIESGSSWDLELPFITAKGNRRWVRAVGKPVAENGTVVRLLGSFQDITERRAREAKLREVSTRLAMTLETSSIGGWEYCQDAESVDWDETTRALYGYPLDREMPSVAEFGARIHPDDRKRVLGSVAKAFADFGEISEEFRFRAWDDRELHLRSYGRVLARLDAPPILTGFNYDITADVETARELDRRREEAEAANLAKSQFLANMSHEIRTPLNGVLGMAQLLRLTSLDQTQSRYVDTLEASGDALLDLIEDVLDIAKIESGLAELRKEAFGLDDLLSEVKAILGPAIEGKGLTLSLDRASGLPERLVGDQKRTRQVLINMVGNATKFTESGSIAVRVSAGANDRIRFEVSDTGPGIPADQLERVFERFAQVDDSSTRKHGGTGLGLAICREIVEMAGGTIGVESEFGSGSCFWFEIPFKADRAASTADAESASPASCASASATGRVLVVDDVATNQLVAAAFVRSAGYDVVLAENGQAALDQLAETSFDVVLMDMQMPVMSGEEAIRRVRASGKPYQSVPIFAVTADATSGARSRYLDSGANGYLSKPLDREAVLGALASVIGAPA